MWSWWMWIGAAAGLEIHGNWKAATACAVAGFIFYLLAPPEHIPQYGLDTDLSVRSQDFLASVVGATGVPFVKGNKVTVLNNGDAFFPAMLEAIRGAQHSITMEAYIYWNCDIGLQFANAMAECRRAGVIVKLLLDAIGSASLGKEIEQIFKESECELAWYNPIRLRTLGRINNRTHRKSLIVDGRIAFTGGAGIADHWRGNAQDPKHWRDMQIRLEGPGAYGLQTGFAQNWLATTGELISGPDFFPLADSAGTMSVQTILSRPEVGSSGVRIMYYLSIISARDRILIANPYFIPDDSTIDILVGARRRGVEIRIIVAGIYNDMRISRYSSIHLYGKLLEAGVEIYEYNRTMLHHKMMVVDGIWCTVGSTNFDNRSFALDEESNVCVFERRLAEELENSFNDDLRSCDPVSLEKWRRRGWTTRVLGAACVFLKEQT